MNKTSQKDIKGTFIINNEKIDTTPFGFLCTNKKIDKNIEKILKQLNGDVNIDSEILKGSTVLTALQWNLVNYTNEKYNLIKFLIDNHADVDSVFKYDNVSYSPLLIACQKQDENLFNLIIDNITTVNSIISYRENGTIIEATVLAYLLQEKQKTIFQELAIKTLKEMGGQIESGNTSLFSILSMNNPNEKLIIDYLETNVDPSIANSNGKNVIDYAFEKNLSLVIDWLLKNKVEIGNSLYYAIDNELKGNQSFIKEFLDINKKDIKSKTIVNNDTYISCSPIVYTMLIRQDETLSQQRIKIITELINAGFDINETIKGGRYSGCSPLMFAAKSKSSQLVDFLLENGADVYKQNAIGKTALFYALESKNKDEVNALVKKMNEIKDIQLNSHEEENRSLLMYFAQYGDFELLKEIIPKIIDNDKYALERTDSKGMTPFLYAAAYNPDYRVMKLLRMYGANVYAKDTNKKSAYVLANENAEENVKKIKLERIQSYGVYE